MTTAFISDEKTFWHGGGNYAFMLPVGGLVQPMAAGGLPENPETKRRLKNLMQVTGLIDELAQPQAAPATRADLERVHTVEYLDDFKRLSDAGGGELGRRTPFGPGGYDIAALSAGITMTAVQRVLDGTYSNAYALSRPPGHHCLPDFPNGFCLLANIAIAVEAAKAAGQVEKVAILDWDVHHGNGSEAIFYDRNDVLTISFHQDSNYPPDTGAVADRGRGAGEGFNLNVPLHAGGGHTAYLHAMDRIALPAIRAFEPDLIIVACGFDAAVVDPLSSMLATVETFRAMTLRIKTLAQEVCGGKLVLAHEGGYSEVYVPFCGHATIAALAGSEIDAGDPFLEPFTARQPNAKFDAFLKSEIDDIAREFGL